MRVRSFFSGVMLSLLAGAAFAAANPFAPPAEFEPDIRFWTRIYTEVGTDGGLLHDERYLGVVYERMQFPKDLASSERARRVTAAKEKYRSILHRLATAEAAEDESESRRVRALWPENTGARVFEEAGQRIRFQLGQANRFREGLIRSGAYEAHIAETLANRGLPPELAALPHVESSFDPTARSHAGAAGLWQFIRSTGRRYMRVDKIVDERMDPYRSTLAAAQFLKLNYDLLGTWPLALTAYNHGPAGMRRAKEQLGTDDIVTIARKYQSRTFGFASRNYYIAFLAALEVDRNAEKYFGPLERRAEMKTHPVLLPAAVRASALERAFGLDRDLLRMLNPSLTSAVWRGERQVPRGFELRLPESFAARDDMTIRLAGLTDSERANVQKEAQKQKEETAQQAKRKEEPKKPQPRKPAPKPSPPPSPPIPEAAIAEVEVVTEREVASTEKEIVRSENAEPVSEAQAEAFGPQGVASEQSPLSADPSDYTVAADLTIEVQAAETIGHIAEWLDTRAGTLRKLNKMRGKQPVVIGRRLKIELAHVSVDEFERRRRAYHQNLQEAFFVSNRIAGTEIHIVRRGESLWSIAQKYPRAPIWLLRQHNPDLDFDDVRPNTRLVLPLVESISNAER